MNGDWWRSLPAAHPARVGMRAIAAGKAEGSRLLRETSPGGGWRGVYGNGLPGNGGRLVERPGGAAGPSYIHSAITWSATTGSDIYAPGSGSIGVPFNCARWGAVWEGAPHAVYVDTAGTVQLVRLDGTTWSTVASRALTLPAGVVGQPCLGVAPNGAELAFAVNITQRVIAVFRSRNGWVPEPIPTTADDGTDLSASGYVWKVPALTVTDEASMLLVFRVIDPADASAIYASLFDRSEGVWSAPTRVSESTPTEAVDFPSVDHVRQTTPGRVPGARGPELPDAAGEGVLHPPGVLFSHEDPFNPWPVPTASATIWFCVVYELQDNSGTTATSRILGHVVRDADLLATGFRYAPAGEVSITGSDSARDPCVCAQEDGTFLVAYTHAGGRSATAEGATIDVVWASPPDAEGGSTGGRTLPPALGPFGRPLRIGTTLDWDGPQVVGSLYVVTKGTTEIRYPTNYPNLHATRPYPGAGPIGVVWEQGQTSGSNNREVGASACSGDPADPAQWVLFGGNQAANTASEQAAFPCVWCEYDDSTGEVVVHLFYQYGQELPPDGSPAQPTKLVYRTGTWTP